MKNTIKKIFMIAALAITSLHAIDDQSPDSSSQSEKVGACIGSCVSSVVKSVVSTGLNGAYDLLTSAVFMDSAPTQVKLKRAGGLITLGLAGAAGYYCYKMFRRPTAEEQYVADVKGKIAQLNDLNRVAIQKMEETRQSDASDRPQHLAALLGNAELIAYQSLVLASLSFEIENGSLVSQCNKVITSALFTAQKSLIEAGNIADKLSEKVDADKIQHLNALKALIAEQYKKVMAAKQAVDNIEQNKVNDQSFLKATMRSFDIKNHQQPSVSRLRSCVTTIAAKCKSGMSTVRSWLHI